MQPRAKIRCEWCGKLLKPNEVYGCPLCGSHICDQCWGPLGDICISCWELGEEDEDGDPG